MSAFLRRHLTYANVAATLALIFALGGTTYAAFRLPRDSVGSAQIRRGAVQSSAIRDHTIQLSDLARSTRRSLRGPRGPAGQTGAQGPAGTSAVRHFAAVSAAGELLRGDATSSDHSNAGSGQYTIGFSASTSACGYVATIGTTDGAVPPAGRVTVHDAAGKVVVQTYDAAGAPADLPFFLVVGC